MRRLSTHLIGLALVAGLALGCGAEDGSAGGDNAGSDAGAATVDAGGAGTDGGGAADTATATPKPPDPIPYSGNTDCPKLEAGSNKLWSWGETRKVDLYLPKTTKDAPLLFLWHGLGDNKENFGKAMGAAQLASSLGAVVVVPQGGLKYTGWGWGTKEDSTEDAALFDDLLFCIDDQYDIDNNRVWSMGFSAGALWTSWLAMHRSTYLAAAVMWSGGTGQSANKYKKPKRKVPALMSHGGPNDVAGLKFEETTNDMSAKLAADGHYVVVCNHGLGHTIPAGGLNWALDFLKRHPWNVGASPLVGDAEARKLYPSYCSFP